jgi:hypothetical protein
LHVVPKPSILSSIDLKLELARNCGLPPELLQKKPAGKTSPIYKSISKYIKNIDLYKGQIKDMNKLSLERGGC